MENKKLDLVLNEEKANDIELFNIELNTDQKVQINLSEDIKNNITPAEVDTLCLDIKEHLSIIINKLIEIVNDSNIKASNIDLFNVILDTEGEINIVFNEDIKKIKNPEELRNMLNSDVIKYLTPIIQKLIIAAF